LSASGAGAQPIGGAGTGTTAVDAIQRSAGATYVPRAAPPGYLTAADMVPSPAPQSAPVSGIPAPAHSAAPAYPMVPGASFSSYGPGQDLQSAQILPGFNADRFKMAQDQVQRWFDQNDPLYKDSIRQATQAATGAGRLGSGMLRTDYGNLADRFLQGLNTTKSAALDKALGDTVNDYSNYRDEARTERGYQTGQSQSAIDRMIQQLQLEEQLTNGQFGREQSRLGLIGNIGFVNPNTSPFMQGAQQSQDQASDLFGGVGDLLQQYALRQMLAGVRPTGG
ncbi:MAG: hypothetical protein ACREGL_02130, partial [Alphaproteobacteria bacterium]